MTWVATFTQGDPEFGVDKKCLHISNARGVSPSEHVTMKYVVIANDLTA